MQTNLCVKINPSKKPNGNKPRQGKGIDVFWQVEIGRGLLYYKEQVQYQAISCCDQQRDQTFLFIIDLNIGNHSFFHHNDKGKAWSQNGKNEEDY
jgi:hypothetical protein